MPNKIMNGRKEMRICNIRIVEVQLNSGCMQSAASKCSWYWQESRRSSVGCQSAVVESPLFNTLSGGGCWVTAPQCVISQRTSIGAKQQWNENRLVIRKVEEAQPVHGNAQSKHSQITQSTHSQSTVKAVKAAQWYRYPAKHSQSTVDRRQSVD